MSRENRYYEPRQVYEIVSRTKAHQPFPPTELSNEILAGILGRALGALRIILCHFVFMANHDHHLALSEDGEGLSNFYRDIKKHMTDAVKVLASLEQLNMWQDRSNVMHIPLLRDILRKILYIYANPVVAGLVDSIDDYPGLNSWKAFLECAPRIDACVRVRARYYRKQALEKLPALPEDGVLSAAEDLQRVEQLRGLKKAVEPAEVVVYPFAWLALFNITEPEQIQRIRDTIVRLVRRKEARLREQRARSGQRVMGAERLKRAQYMGEMIPKKHHRQVSVSCSDRVLRVKLIDFRKRLQEECKVLYRRARKGEVVLWPDGVFIPWLPTRWSGHAAPIAMRV
jgi:hypothetical protein